MQGQFLRIANPGIADPTALTILGVGNTREAHVAGTIGMFASGSKLAAGLLLRNNLSPTIVMGNLRMTYGIEPITSGGQGFRQVMVKYGGTDINGKSKSSTEKLGYTLEWGTADWNDLTMAPREYVANAIDGTLLQGLSLDQVEIGLVDNIRAKAGWTQVYIPTFTMEDGKNEDIHRFFQELNLRFLHFGHADLLKRKLLPKLVPNESKTRIYKHGVLVAVLDYPSVWDYNLGDELSLDESRNASEWTVKHAISKALAHADAGALALVIKMTATADNKAELVETTLTADYLKDRYDTATVDARRAQWQQAFKSVAGENGVASSGLTGVDSHLENKGMKPFQVPANWLSVLEEMQVPTENQVLKDSHNAGENFTEPSADMVKVLDETWALLESFEMTRGKEKPPVKGFVQLMVGGSQKLGEYRKIDGVGTVLIHNDIGATSTMLRTTMLEELVHHITGAGDMSRDLQDFLFRLVVVMAF